MRICGCQRAAETYLYRDSATGRGEDRSSPQASMKLLERCRTCLSRGYKLGDRLMTTSMQAVIMAFTQRTGVCTSLPGATVKRTH